MTPESTKQSSEPKKQKNLLAECVGTLEWLVTAFMLAFVFRAFVMEAFRIPTGSMADTLKGAHFRLQCPECGYCYDYGFDPGYYGMPPETVPLGRVPLSPSGGPRDARGNRYSRLSTQMKCPSCGYYMPQSERREVYNGDRILVLKCIYQIFEPDRWDVVVFKNPLQPKESYIKRLIAKPGETVEIIDGDIYINGRIARKPPKVQEELWSVIYDNDYQPVAPEMPKFNGKEWQQPFKNVEGSKWELDGAHPAVYRLDSASGVTNAMTYDTSQGNDLKAVYSYNDVSFAQSAEYCSDLKIRFYVTCDGDGSIGTSLSKYETVYKAIVNMDGEIIISRTTGQSEEEKLKRTKVEPFSVSTPTAFSFANIDHRLVLQFGNQLVEVDMGDEPDSMGTIPERPEEASVTVFGSGKLRLSHIALFRDIHYLSRHLTGSLGRGCRSNPFTLKADEFFVLGDNSPNSQDCRWWASEGLGNGGKTYRPGVVPRDHLVGKAAFVYWPSGFTIFESIPLLVVPDFGQLRLIYGGSNRQF